MNSLFENKKPISVLTQAKITAIDKLSGRISLYMKNGLISTGTYLYDLNDLSVGSTVLVGKVEDTYVVMNKISNSPRKSEAITLRKSAPTAF